MPLCMSSSMVQEVSTLVYLLVGVLFGDVGLSRHNARQQ